MGILSFLHGRGVSIAVFFMGCIGVLLGGWLANIFMGCRYRCHDPRLKQFLHPV